MSIDFSALTAAVGMGLPEVRACLIVSREGLALGAYPREEEGRAMNAWTRVAGLGDVERGFVGTPEELWVFSRRGAYAAVALALPTARPGVVLDTLDQMLLMAEEARTRKDALKPRAVPAPAVPSSLPGPEAGKGVRSVMHADARQAQGRIVQLEPDPSEGQAAEATIGQRPYDSADPIVGRSTGGPPPSVRPPSSDAPLAPEPMPPSERVPNADRFSIAREFAELLREAEEEQ
jgi:hypothetical protein